jgi:hypothetical protein
MGETRSRLLSPLIQQNRLLFCIENKLLSNDSLGFSMNYLTKESSDTHSWLSSSSCLFIRKISTFYPPDCLRIARQALHHHHHHPPTMTNPSPSEAPDLNQPIVIVDDDTPQSQNMQITGSSANGKVATETSNIQVFGAPQESTYILPCASPPLHVPPHTANLFSPPSTFQPTSPNHTSPQQPPTSHLRKLPSLVVQQRSPTVLYNSPHRERKKHGRRKN